MKVLLLPDDAGLAKSLTDLYGADKIDIYTADSARHSLRLLESNPTIDLVIINPGTKMDACITLLQNMRESPRYFWIPVMAVSKNWDASRVSRCVDLNVNQMLVEPYSSKALSEKIENALANGKRRILIVEDDELLLALLQNIFELERFDVIGVGSVEKALETLKGNTVHIIITDVLLPGMTGFDLLKISKEQHPEIPVVLVTGHSGNYTLKDAQALGADGYFSKPFKNLELIQIARKLTSISNRNRQTNSISS